MFENLTRAQYETLLRQDFATFAARCFQDLNPQTELAMNWHLEVIAAKLTAVREGKIRRLIINLPPRHLKSLMASIAFPAWCLGQDPSAQILCVSYGQLVLLYITHDIASARYFSDEVLVMYAGQIVERGPAEALTQEPAHPYTQLLVASAPDPDNIGSILRSGGKKAVRTADSAPRVIEALPFNPRCPFVQDRCRSEDPPLVRISSTRARGLLAPGCCCATVARPKQRGCGA